eukprot:TRINITY_DN30763_c0_g1_i1.p1 TRINITY_DN30763_c0_g1~~TRINITY_DN30763_c0_g1_i1.p1  ORF type:complete len:350 (+),score=73.46 TRINITY_DN30763_c0_g1_i1:24-1052(+)
MRRQSITVHNLLTEPSGDTESDSQGASSDEAEPSQLDELTKESLLACWEGNKSVENSYISYLSRPLGECDMEKFYKTQHTPTEEPEIEARQLTGDPTADDRPLLHDKLYSATYIIYGYNKEKPGLLIPICQHMEGDCRVAIEAEEYRAMQGLYDDCFHSTIDLNIFKQVSVLAGYGAVLSEEEVLEMFKNTLHLVSFLSVKRRWLVKKEADLEENEGGDIERLSLQKQRINAERKVVSHVHLALARGGELLLCETRRLSLIEKHLYIQTCKKALAEESFDHDAYNAALEEQDFLNTQTQLTHARMRYLHSELRHVSTTKDVSASAERQAQVWFEERVAARET